MAQQIYAVISELCYGGGENMIKLFERQNDAETYQKAYFEQTQNKNEALIVPYDIEIPSTRKVYLAVSENWFGVIKRPVAEAREEWPKCFIEKSECEAFISDMITLFESRLDILMYEKDIL